MDDATEVLLTTGMVFTLGMALGATAAPQPIAMGITTPTTMSVGEAG